MALLASTLSHTAHSGVVRSQIGPNSGNLTWRLSSLSQMSRSVGSIQQLVSPSLSCKTRSNISLRSRAVRISSQLGDEAVKSSKQVPSRDSFPTGFIFGASTSAYQTEGAWNEDGKGPNTWDYFCHNYPERIVDGSNGDVAVNSYNLYEEDVKMLKAMGMSAYRFSVSWSRILPDGTLQGGINPEGIQFYKNLINLLKENDIEPYVTLFHWDTPQALVEKYGGFLDKRIVKDYADFAEVCFKNFGDKVKNWFTFNEPYVFCTYAYGTGAHAPGRCSPGQDCADPTGNSLTEPYLVGHHLLLSHVEAADVYKSYKGEDGRIGMALVSDGYEPYDKMFVHEQARERSIDQHLGWFLEPMFRGDYPFSMRSLVRDRLPYFTDDEKKKLVTSYDMMGLNYYSSSFSKNIDFSAEYTPVLNTDDTYAEVTLIGPDGNLIGPNTGLSWLYSYPKGLKDLLMIIKNKYGNPPIYITENGVGDMDDGTLTMENALNDTTRLNYLKDHISTVKESIDLGADVRGHFTWSLMDNFEWSSGGYGVRFGLIYVDRNNGFKRHMKKSAQWFAEYNTAVVKEKMISATTA